MKLWVRLSEMQLLTQVRTKENLLANAGQVRAIKAQKLDTRLLNLTDSVSSLGSPECSTWFSMSILDPRKLGLELGIGKEGCVNPSKQDWGGGSKRGEPWLSQALQGKA